MDRGRTITDSKSAFIRSQVRLLTAPLQRSLQWRDYAPEAAEGELSEKVVQDLVAKVNEKIKQHNRMVFSGPSQRHVAEQIDTLYWNTVTKDTGLVDGDAVMIQRAADLTSIETVESLPEDPEDLSLTSEQPPNDEESARYRDLHTRLTMLSKRRDQQQAQLAQYQQLQTLLQPFENAPTNIQPNLVTRDGELSKELDRMRILLARVTGRISETKSTDPNTRPPVASGLSNEEKLGTVMDLT